MTAKQPIAPWLLKHLETKTGGFRAARWIRCKRCDQLTLVGMDADLAAIVVTVDPTPLTPELEKWMDAAKRRTFHARINGRRVTLLDRSPGAVGTPCTEPVVPEHRCGARVPGFLKLAPKTEDTEQTPPF